MHAPFLPDDNHDRAILPSLQNAERSQCVQTITLTSINNFELLKKNDYCYSEVFKYEWIILRLFLITVIFN